MSKEGKASVRDTKSRRQKIERGELVKVRCRKKKTERSDNELHFLDNSAQGQPGSKTGLVTGHSLNWPWPKPHSQKCLCHDADHEPDKGSQSSVNTKIEGRGIACYEQARSRIVIISVFKYLNDSYTEDGIHAGHLLCATTKDNINSRK